MSEIVDIIKNDICAGDSSLIPQFIEHIEYPSYREGDLGAMETAAQKAGWKFTVKESAEGEGGPSSQNYLIEAISLNDPSDVRYVRIPVEWVSWDGMYYDYAWDSMKEVFAVVKTIVVYE